MRSRFLIPGVANDILIFAPMSLFIGISASAIGYTAWSLLVPILFVGFGLDLYLSLFISLMVDCGNAVVMTIIGITKRQTDVTVGLKLAVLAGIFVIPGIYMGTGFLPRNAGLFRGTLGFMTMFIGFFFILRGYRAGRAEMTGTVDETIVEFGFVKRIINGVVKKMILHIGVAFTGVVTGLIGIGGGMNYSLLFMLFRSFGPRRAAGTAMLMTAVTTFLAAIGILLQVPDTVPMDSPTRIMTVIIVLMSMAGTWIGAKVAYALSETKINYLIGIVIILASTAVTIQCLVLK
jgi:uncharacterized membrane protein YfcA